MPASGKFRDEFGRTCFSERRSDPLADNITEGVHRMDGTACDIERDVLAVVLK
jgi:hypothetical protein